MTTACATALLGSWWPQTGRSLRALDPRDAPLAPDLARAAGGGGRVALRAARWWLGGTPARGECRLVRIEGAASEIVNVLGFPADPRTTPTFVAEGLVFGGRLRLAFVDVQMPGMTTTAAVVVARRTAELADRFGRAPVEPALPRWAVEHSPGNFFLAREQDGAASAALELAYRAYLDLWVERMADCAVPTTAPPADLAEFKQGHLTHWPGTDYLAKLFGADWSRRFIHEFLYR